jgi:WD40 repeat protein
MIHDFLISADGERLVTLGFDHALRVWDMATGAVVAGPLVDETRMTLAVPNRDATLIASASEDGGTRIWDLTKDRPLVAQLGSDNETPVRFSPDGRLLITKSPSQVIHIWDIASGSPSISRVLKVPDLSFGATSRDGHYILTQTVDGNVQIWNPATGQPAGLPLLAAARIAAAEFSEDDTRVAVSTDDGVTRVWSVPAGRLLGPALRNTSN